MKSSIMWMCRLESKSGMWLKYMMLKNVMVVVVVVILGVPSFVLSFLPSFTVFLIVLIDGIIDKIVDMGMKRAVKIFVMSSSLWFPFVVANIP